MSDKSGRFITPELDVLVGTAAAITIIGVDVDGVTVIVAGQIMHDRGGEHAFLMEFDPLSTSTESTTIKSTPG